MIRRMLLLGALATGALLVANVDARAGYSYTTGTVTTSVAISGLTTETITPLSGTGGPDGTPNQQNFINFNFSGFNTNGTTVQTLTWQETLSSTTLTANQVEVFALTQVITFTVNSGSPSGIGGVLGPFTQGVVSGGAAGFVINTPGYSVTSTNGSGTPANLSYFITSPSLVPEPSSIVMLGSGVAGILGVGLRRMRKKKNAAIDAA